MPSNFCLVQSGNYGVQLFTISTGPKESRYNLDRLLIAFKNLYLANGIISALQSGREKLSRLIQIIGMSC
jgi:hypothetical protein